MLALFDRDISVIQRRYFINSILLLWFEVIAVILTCDINDKLIKF